MRTDRINDVNIVSSKLLPTPAEIKARLPLTAVVEKIVFDGRETIRNILDRKDARLMVVVGPCSIHDIEAALEYAGKLRRLAAVVRDTFFVVMRVYFEKPRTSIGWKGFINDPFRDDSFRIDEGLRLARGFLLKIAEMGLPVGTEALDPVTPQYLADLWAWAAIGARTAESQTHREMASGLSMPVGFKNGTDGRINVAIDGLKSATRPHSFLGITESGQCAVFHTSGNEYGHIVLRGGESPNYDPASIAECEQRLLREKLPVNIVVDCSHGNSGKNPARQGKVLTDCAEQIARGNKSIVGFMIESYLLGGSQPFSGRETELLRGISITDPCLDWPATETLLLETREKMKDALPARHRLNGTV